MGGSYDEDGGRRPPRHHQPKQYHSSSHHQQQYNDQRHWSSGGNGSSRSPSHGSRRAIQRSEGMTPRSSQGRFPSAEPRREATMPPSTIHVARSSTQPYRRPSDPRAYLDEDLPVTAGRRYSAGHGGTSYESRRYMRHQSAPLYEDTGPRVASPDIISGSDDSESESESKSEDGTTSSEEDEEDEEDEEEEADDEASPSRRRGRPLPASRPETPDEAILARRPRHQRPPSISSDDGSRPVSPAAPVARMSKRALEGAPHPRLIEAPPFRREPTATPSPRTSRSRVSSILAESRPPVSSKRRSKHAEPVIHHESSSSRLRNKTPSSRSSARSSSHSRPNGRMSTPEKMRLRQHGKDKPVVKSVECVACMENKSSQKAPKLKCGHRMCHSCLKRSFELSIKDPQHMPPKCCTEDSISLKHVEALFDNNFKKLWNRKSAEYRTKNRVYCPSKKCGEWIKPSLIKRDGQRHSARCDRCNTKVCVACNGKWHSSPDCPQDEETQRFLRQAKEEGWQRCYSCKSMVERKQGCNHMTCRCGAQFCMVCGVKWRNCDCEWFNFEGDDNLNGYYAERGHQDNIVYAEDPPVPRLTRGSTDPGRRAGRPRAWSYEDEARHRRAQEQQDEDLARRLQYEMSLDGDDLRRVEDDDDDDDDDDDEADEAGAGLGLGISSGRAASEHYEHRRRGSGRHKAMPPPVPDAPMGRSYEREKTYPSTNSSRYERGGYVTEIHKARGSRGERSRSMERRLADRMSHSRYAVPGRPDMPMGVPPPHMSPRHHMSPHMGAPPPPLPLMGGPHYGPVPVPVPMPMSMPPPSRGPMMMSAPIPPMSYRSQPYGPSYAHPPDMIGEPGPFGSPDLEGHRRRNSDSVPRSSTLAGLDGPPGGVGRVFEWRNFVEPTYEDDESVQS